MRGALSFAEESGEGCVVDTGSDSRSATSQGSRRFLVSGRLESQSGGQGVDGIGLQAEGTAATTTRAGKTGDL